MGIFFFTNLLDRLKKKYFVFYIEFASRQIRAPSQIFDFLGLFCRKFNPDSHGTNLINFGYALAEI